MVSRHHSSGQTSLLGLSVWFVSIGSAFLLLWSIALGCYRRHRERRRGDGILTLDEWEPHVRGTLSFASIIGVIVPLCFFLLSFVCGAMLAVIEGWSFDDSFEYVLGNAVGIGPLTDVTPTTLGGKVGNIVVSLFSLIGTSTVLGLCATSTTAMQLITGVDTLGKRMLCLVLFLVVPAMLVVIAFASGCLLAGLEGWNVTDGFYFMVGSLAGVETPMTDEAPQKAEGNFVTCLGFTLELAIAGVLIGMVGDHPALHRFMDMLEGSHDDADVQPQIDSLEELVRNGNWEVRAATADLMGKLGNSAYTQALSQAAANDDVPKVREAATSALAQLLQQNDSTDCSLTEQQLEAEQQDFAVHDEMFERQDQNNTEAVLNISV